MNIMAIIAFSAILLSYLFAGLYAISENTVFENVKKIFTNCNTGSVIIGMLFLLILAYMVYSLTWEMNFSRNSVFLWTLGTLISFWGEEPGRFYIHVPFGAIIVWIAMNCRAAEILSAQNDDGPTGDQSQD